MFTRTNGCRNVGPQHCPSGCLCNGNLFFFLMEPLPHSNKTPKISQSFASLTASEHPLAPESLSISTTPVFPLAPDLHSAHPPAPGIIPSCASAPTATPPDSVAHPFYPSPVVPYRLRYSRTLSLVLAPSCHSTAPYPVSYTYSAFRSASAAVLPTVDPVTNCAAVAVAPISVEPDLYSFLRSCQSPTVLTPPSDSGYPATALIHELYYHGFPMFSFASAWRIPRPMTLLFSSTYLNRNFFLYLLPSVEIFQVTH